MNKKVVLSVLATAVVASMAASAFAAPKQGLYIGGNVKKFYSTSTLLNMTKDARTAYKNELKTAGFQNLVFVNIKGQGATIKEMIDLGTKVALADPLKQSDFLDSYGVVQNDGTVSGTEEPGKHVDPTTPGELKVESVSAINAKTIEVKFSKAVLASTVVDSANDTLVDGAITVTPLGNPAAPAVTINDAAAELSTDGKTLTLTADAAEYFKGEYAVTVTTAVTDADGKQVAPYSTILKNVDTVRPTVTEVKYDNFQTAKVYFSEPLASHGTVSVTGGAAGTQPTVTHNAGDNFVTVNLAASTASVEYTVTFVGAKDYSDNLISPNPVTVKVKKDVADTTKPVLSNLSTVNDKTFTLTFSEKLIANPVVKVAGKTVVAGAPGAGEIQGTITKDTAGLVYTVTLASSLVTTPGANSDLVQVVVDYSDLSNNAGDTFTRVVEFKKDTAGPKYVSSSVEKINGVEYLVVTFDEDVTLVDDKDITGKVVKDFVESPVTIVTDSNATDSAVAPEVDADITLHNAVNGKSKSVKIDLSKLTSGAYTVDLPAGLVTDGTTNSDAKTGITFNRTSNVVTAKPALTTAGTNGIQVSNNNTLLVNFDKKLDSASALNTANYAVEGAVVSGAIFTKNDSTGAIVKLTLQAGSVTLNGDRTITISNVKSDAGVAMDTVTTTEDLKENVAPTLTSAVLTGLDTITLTFSEAMDDATLVEGSAAADFDVFVDGVNVADLATPIAVTEAGTGATYTLTFDRDLTPAEFAKSIVIKPASGIDATDANGNAFVFTSATVTK